MNFSKLDTTSNLAARTISEPVQDISISNSKCLKNGSPLNETTLPPKMRPEQTLEQVGVLIAGILNLVSNLIEELFSSLAGLILAEASPELLTEEPPITCPDCTKDTNAPEAPKESSPEDPVGVADSFDKQDFDQTVRELVGKKKGNKVHEEEFQFAIATYLIKANKGEIAMDKFTSAFNSSRSRGANGVENAVKKALRIMVKNGVLSKTEAQDINGASFEAAQLDSNKAALYDGHGGPGDNTIAVMRTGNAINRAVKVLEAIQSGQRDVNARKLRVRSNKGSAQNDSNATSSSSAEFLWKPKSESDGKLVVLLPSEFRGSVISTRIYSALPASSETFVEEGRFSGDDHNGNRPHYRFRFDGGSYPKNSYVVATMRNGETVSFKIGETSSRN